MFFAVPLRMKSHDIWYCRTFDTPRQPFHGCSSWFDTLCLMCSHDKEKVIIRVFDVKALTSSDTEAESLRKATEILNSGKRGQPLTEDNGLVHCSKSRVISTFAVLKLHPVLSQGLTPLFPDDTLFIDKNNYRY